MACTSRPSGLEHLSVRAEAAHLAPIAQSLEADAIRLRGVGIEDRDLRDRQRHLLLEDPALLSRLRIAALVLFHSIDVLDEHAAALEHLNDSAASALVSPGEHDDRVT